jgi:hypothetical protein
MRFAAVMVLLNFACGCAHQPAGGPMLEEELYVLGHKECAPYAPNHSIALSRDFEARLIRSGADASYPKPHCWYVTPSGELLLRASQSPVPLDDERPDRACVEPDRVPQQHLESPDAETSGSATPHAHVKRIDLPDESRGLVAFLVCYRNEGTGWHVAMVSISTGT